MSAGTGAGKVKRGCELCGAAARVYCGADEATLCWGCDARVHGANFLVARHARALLCRGCARPTPWRAAGPRLGPTASLCDRCVRGGVPGGDAEMGGPGGGRRMREEEEEHDDDCEDEEEDDRDEEGEGENQVVPWAEEDSEATTATATPPPVASSTSGSSSHEASANAAERAKEELDIPCSTSSVRGSSNSSRSDEATSSRNGGRSPVARHRTRSPSGFLSSGSPRRRQQQSVSGSGTWSARNCSNARVGRNGFA